MSPVSSAIGMNLSGGTLPRSLLIQRASASKPTSAPLPIDLGLVDDADLTTLQRASQPGFQHHALGRLRTELAREELIIALALLLGQVHGGVGALDQIDRRLAVARIQADTNAAGNDELLWMPFVADINGLGYFRQQAVEQPGDRCGLVVIVEHQHKLVSAVARHGIGLAQAGLEAARDFDKQAVAPTDDRGCR